MVRTIVTLFLFAHGFVHSAVWVMPRANAQAPPFDPAHSWALGLAHVNQKSSMGASVVFAWLATAAFALAAVMVAVDVPAWSVMAVMGAAIGLVLKLLWFNPWLTLGVALDVAVIAAVVAGYPSSLF
jgi:hypothetical protein